MSEIMFKGLDEFVRPINFVKMYSDGTPMVKTDEWEEIVEHADTMVLRPNSLSTFVTAMFLYDALIDAGSARMKLVMPYIPGARQDRSISNGDVLFTALSVAKMINSRPFSRVVTLDPHSEVVINHIHHTVDEFPLELIAEKMWQGYCGIIAPDKGARDRAEAFAAAMNLDITYASKNRDAATGRLSGFSVEVEEGKHYLVVDDICDGGGTFIGLGEKIREQGAYADLYVSHGIFTKGTEGLKKFYKNIYTTDSRTRHERSKVSVVPVVEEMENYND